jgi:hypothetical protein
MGTPKVFVLLFFKGATLIGPSVINNFFEHWALLRHIYASHAQNKNIDMLHFGTFFTFYIQVGLW